MASLLSFFLWLSGVTCIGIGIVVLGFLAQHFIKGLFPVSNDDRLSTSKALPDLPKIIDALGKAPLWLAAILVGDIQLWLSAALSNGKWPF